ncbi:MAG: radical SAM protein [Lachnospiraceae bacterium]|nr:radical SAM protein [Lachnospiraceae bacterium]
MDTFVEKYKELKSLLPNEKPIGIVFKTKVKKYYYDTATGKALVCGDIEFLLLDRILSDDEGGIFLLAKDYPDEISNALENIISTIKSENILKVSKFSSMNIPLGYEKLIENNLEHIILEITEKCNLRCGYCTYNEDCDTDRGFSERDMPDEIAFKAIDYIFNNSVDNSKISISFYGGEPLLKYKLMKECIEYAKSINSKIDIHYSFTTNCTLVTQEIANDLSKLANISILCSIDGPKEIHDLYRKDSRGIGSFDNAIKGLRLLVEAFGERAKEVIAINAVYAPPFSFDKIENIKKFFEELTWFPNEIMISASYPRNESVPLLKNYLNKTKPDENLCLDFDYEKWDMSLYEWCLQNYDSKGIFLTQMSNQLFTRLYRRNISDQELDKIPFNGCCIPGQRRLYVMTNGDFKVCERVGEAPVMGNLDVGINKKSTKNIYIKNYERESMKKCAYCWLAKICDICFASCYDSNGLNIEKKEMSCLERKTSYIDIWTSYFEKLEVNPYCFDELNYELS